MGFVREVDTDDFLKGNLNGMMEFEWSWEEPGRASRRARKRMTSGIAIHIAATGKTIARATTYVGVEGLEELSTASLEVLIGTGTKVTEVPVLVTATLMSTPLMVVGTTVVVVKNEVLLLRVTDAWPALTAKVVGGLRVVRLGLIVCGSGVALRLRTGTEVTGVPVLATPTVLVIVRTAVVVMIVVLRTGTTAARLALLVGTPAVQGGGVLNTTTDTDLRARIAEVE